MLKVIATGKMKYKGISREPYQEFLIDDKDKDMMVKLGCTVIAEKVVNATKVEPKKVETKVETKVDTKTDFKSKDKEEK